MAARRQWNCCETSSSLNADGAGARGGGRSWARNCRRPETGQFLRLVDYSFKKRREYIMFFSKRSLHEADTVVLQPPLGQFGTVSHKLMERPQIVLAHKNWLAAPGYVFLFNLEQP